MGASGCGLVHGPALILLMDMGGYGFVCSPTLLFLAGTSGCNLVCSPALGLSAGIGPAADSVGAAPGALENIIGSLQRNQKIAN